MAVDMEEVEAGESSVLISDSETLIMIMIRSGERSGAWRNDERGNRLFKLLLH